MTIESVMSIVPSSLESADLRQSGVAAPWKRKRSRRYASEIETVPSEFTSPRRNSSCAPTSGCVAKHRQTNIDRT